MSLASSHPVVGSSRCRVQYDLGLSRVSISVPSHLLQALVNSGARRMASGDDTVIIVHSNDTSRSENGGVDWTKNSGDLPRTDARDVATDGQGNWIVVHDSGRVSISANDGDSYAEQTGDQGSGNTNMRFPTGGSNVENLDAVAADVLLPV